MAKVRQVAMILIGNFFFTIIVIIIFNLINVLGFNSYLTI